MADAALDRNPVGTGPFVYDKAASREGLLRVYTPNPRYWNPAAQGLARLEIWEIPDDTARLNALKTGQVDVGIWLSSPQAAIIDRSPGLKLVRNAGGYTYQVIISDRAGTKVPAFADPRVRQAMNYAIDRQAFSRAVEFGLAVPAYQPYPPGLPLHDTALENRFAYDPAKARALLAEAGYAKGFEFTMPSIPIFASRLEAIAGFFRAVGITMHIQPVEPGTLARRSRSTDFTAPNLVWNTTWDAKNLPDYFTSEKGDFNPFHVAPTADLAELADQGLLETDPPKRLSIYRKMIQTVAGQSFIIYVTTTPLLFGVTEKSARNPTLAFRPGEDTPYFTGLKANQ
jgi:peptide/nickel transport system substrate-binding protein